MKTLMAFFLCGFMAASAQNFDRAATVDALKTETKHTVVIITAEGRDNRAEADLIAGIFTESGFSVEQKTTNEVGLLRHEDGAIIVADGEKDRYAATLAKFPEGVLPKKVITSWKLTNKISRNALIVIIGTKDDPKQ